MKALTTNTYVKQTKRNLRVWIEGSKLAKAGFNWHTTYSRTIENGVITLRVDANGSLKTAGRKRGEKEIPIIDISLAEMQGFNVGQQVIATFTENKIVIK